MTKCLLDCGSTDYRPRQRRACAHIFVALTIVAGSASGCGDPQEGVDRVESELSATQTFNISGTQRVMKRVCGQRCSKLVRNPQGPPGSGFPGFTCLQYVSDCSAPNTSATLYASAAAAASNVIFPAYNDPTWEYDGCGPQAAQNVLNYYGVQMPIDEVAQHISTFGLVAGSHNQGIATFPDALASGLQSLLNNEVAANHFVVSRRSGVHAYVEVPNAIDNGNPIILLVNGSDHYQVATGYDMTYQTRYYVIDYPNDDQWRNESDMGLQLSTSASVFSTVSFGAGGYEDDTVVSIGYANGGTIYDPPAPSFAATQCNVGGYWMHCCPNGYAMVGADPNSNVFTCSAIDVPGKLGPPTLDTSTQRFNMHSCPTGQVMVGMRVDWNLLACQALPAGSVTGERVDSSTHNGYPMRACEGTGPHTQAMSGIRIDQNLLNCAATVRIH